MVNRLDHLRVISELDNLVMSVRDVDELARRAVIHVCATSQCEVALLLRQGDDREMLCWSSAPAALPTLLIPGLPARVETDQAVGRALNTGKTAVVVEPAHAVVAVPLKAMGDAPLGVLQLRGALVIAKDQTQVAALEMLAQRLALSIANLRAQRILKEQAAQLQILHRLTRQITETLDVEQVYRAIYDSTHALMDCDLFFIALTDEQTKSYAYVLRVEGGTVVSPASVQTRNGLTGHVIQTRRPINISDASDPKPIESWHWDGERKLHSVLCVPMMLGDDVLGALSVQSTRRAAYTSADLEILTIFAGQAAIAINNARHHKLALEQARLDSLTQVLNHGYFLKRLREEVDRAQALAVIMLDIDHFKVYNDTYGHISGDAILRGTVQAIRANIKQTDLVGRWGGEEFVIALLGTNARDAHTVAQRIRTTLAELKLEDDQGRPVPVPTVSQGIATLPDDARDAIALIDLADGRLYQAKARGRDQVSGA